jgi:hypothetical protein
VKFPLLRAVVAMIAAFSSCRHAHRRATNGEQYTMQEIVDAGHGFFGSTSGGLAKVVENAFSKYGLPNGYILGQEGSGAFIAGLTYGEGDLYTKNAGQHNVFWQGPSLGLDYGGQGSRTMMLVYNLPAVPSLYKRFGGVSGSAFVVAGVGMTVLTDEQQRSGSDPHRPWRPPRHQCRLSEADPAADLEPLLRQNASFHSKCPSSR